MWTHRQDLKQRFDTPDQHSFRRVMHHWWCGKQQHPSVAGILSRRHAGRQVSHIPDLLQVYLCTWQELMNDRYATTLEDKRRNMGIACRSAQSCKKVIRQDLEEAARCSRFDSPSLRFDRQLPKLVEGGGLPHCIYNDSE